MKEIIGDYFIVNKIDYACGKCHSIYNPETNSLICPHKPLPKSCSKHERMLCGNLECERELMLLEFSREERKKA